MEGRVESISKSQIVVSYRSFVFAQEKFSSDFKAGLMTPEEIRNASFVNKLASRPGGIGIAEALSLSRKSIRYLQEVTVYVCVKGIDFKGSVGDEFRSYAIKHHQKESELETYYGGSPVLDLSKFRFLTRVSTKGVSSVENPWFKQANKTASPP